MSTQTIQVCADACAARKTFSPSIRGFLQAFGLPRRGRRGLSRDWVDTVTPDWVMAGLLDCRQAMVPVTTKAVAQDERHVDRLALQFQKSVVVIR